MAILVTGGAGYIGSHCVAALLKRGEDVVVADNLSTGYRNAIKGGRFYFGDVADREFLTSVFAKESIVAVFHFAAFSLVGESMEKPEKYFRNNINVTLMLLEVMAEYHVPYLVFSSTAAIFGEAVTIPIDEMHRQEPTNPYGESKKTVEKILGWSDRVHSIKYAALRYFNVAGAASDGNIGEAHQPETHLIPIVLAAAQGKRDCLKLFGTDYETPDGTCVRDYIHVEDLINAHFLALEYLKAGNPSAAFNLGNGQGFSNREVIEAARRVTGKTIEVVEEGRRTGDPAVLIASSQKAKEVLGWEPQYTKIEGIIATAWKWHSTHPNGYT